ncbi:MAG: hypothetical protein DLM53_11130 [Candidatus Eremiobacter antarcticus]|nr:MAG: hypothetical protein DLM53_11130 [Candidatus Eremiobacter sp. RRmetagenome_bin22]
MVRSTKENQVPTDFRDGKTFPRRGRQLMGPFMWLARVIDKARASANGTIHDYIYPCPMDEGAFRRWGITSAEFDEAVGSNATDEEMLDWLQARVRKGGVESANRWISKKKENLDRQDLEEGVDPANSRR